MLFSFGLGLPGALAATHSTTQEATVAFNLPENVELRVLIEFVSTHIKQNIMYDDQVGSQRITIRAPAEVPESSLPGLLESTLRMKGLALVPADQAGWKRIVVVGNLQGVSHPTSQPIADAEDPMPIVTRVISIRHGDAQRIDGVVKPFLTQPGGNSVAVPEQRLLIVTDFASNVERIMKLIGLVDQPAADIKVEVAAIQYGDAGAISQQLIQILLARHKAAGISSVGQAIEIMPDPRNNQLFLVGTADRISEAVSLLQTIDTPSRLETRTYGFVSTSADRVDRIMRESLGGEATRRSYQSAVDRDGNQLIVIATPEIHERIASVKTSLDVPPKAESSRIRFYRLYNTTASAVLQTIQAIESTQDLANAEIDIEPPGSGEGQPAGEAVGARVTGPTESEIRHVGATSEPTEPKSSSAKPLALRTKQATVTADANTNTIIVAADPEVQSAYEQMITRLDTRRPQVLVECTLVTVDTSDDSSIGVEVAVRGGIDDTDFLTFSSFGLSTIDSQTGVLQPQAGTGFNGAVINSDTASAVIRALATNSRARVLSSPKLLVNDNATGTLESIAESPFTSLNASDTVATTSFAGYASAGTSITFTPHISEGDHLLLEYAVTLNSFTGPGSDGIPPPRQTDTLRSKVTVPDGNTVIVGGLNQEHSSKLVQKVPLLGDIPVLKYLASARTQKRATNTLFVFIRPQILRDDGFDDLKYLSQTAIERAQIDDGYPDSEPLFAK